MKYISTIQIVKMSILGLFLGVMQDLLLEFSSEFSP